jgi:hypothetical protein
MDKKYIIVVKNNNEHRVIGYLLTQNISDIEEIKEFILNDLEKC